MILCIPIAATQWAFTVILCACQVWLQEAQLSQRDRAILGVIEYFAKSLKIIRNGILEKGVNPY